jgi:tRNA dimethylallyltransferase
MIRFLVGPSAAGKHQAAMILAEKLGAEIVSIDSVKVYRGLDVGTAKPTAEERRRIRHHLIDIVEPEASYSAGRFVSDARAAAAKISEPLFCGGTFLYYKSYVYGIFSESAIASIRGELEARTTPELHAELAKLDPAARIHANDRKRLIRAVEIARTTGRPISELQTDWKRPVEARAVALVLSRPELRERIARRVDLMLREGLIDETRALLRRKLSREVARAIGYQEALAHLRGELPLERVREEIVRRTWHLCRKQLGWIKSLPELRVVDVSGMSDAALIAEKVLQAWA